MKSMLKKGLVVLFASLFVSGVFAAQSDSANTTNQTEPHATQLVKKKHELCKKAMKCHTNKAGKKGPGNRNEDKDACAPGNGSIQG